MDPHLHPVAHPGFSLGEAATREGDGLRVAHGVHGTALVGPYIALPAGVYRIAPVIEAPAASPLAGVWDVFEQGRGFAARRFATPGDLLIHLPETRALELRVIAQGDGFVLRGFRVEPVLLDGDDLPAPELAELGRSLLAERAEVSALAVVARRLAAAGDGAGAEWLWRQAAGRTRPGPLEGVWAQLGRVHAPLGAVEPEAPAQPPGALADIQAALGEQPLTLFDLLAANWPAEREAIERLGYSLDALQATAFGGAAATRTRRPWQTGRNDLPLYAALADYDFGFQADLASGLGMAAVCPVSGREVRSHHGFVIYEYGLPITFYRFEGAEVFYVCTAGIYNSPAFVYLPRARLCVTVVPRFILDVDFKYLVTVFEANLVRWAGQVRAYLGRPARPAAVLSHANLGHYFWNDVSGFAQAQESGVLGQVHEIVRTAPDYFPLAEIFPEAAGRSTAVLDTPWKLFEHCLTRQLLPVRFTDLQLTQPITARVMDAAARKGPADPRIATAPRPLILINLRAHNKIWIDQAQGYAEILNRLYDEYGQASALIDGWPDCAEIAAAIRAHTRPEVQLYDGLSLPIDETLRWCAAIDAYVCVVGAGLVLVNWLAGKPGVAHADREHMIQLTWWSRVRPDAPAPLQPTLDEIETLGAAAYSNYRVDWRRLYDLLVEALAQAGVRPGRA